ncbi:type II toxin-antitoxin system RelE/ParE family toxin [Oleomonas cavernae]|uniref:Type II toxin-antitoxin system RelE/ParE family toxin n=2 Tax=Oleomonas cavernae TaxID=2320859 RepID=A0A418WJD5_9PROT|nr:type II toxin-antitoxin system RelE/ParE family toxin [Oleomonas cavernae]RJF90070.1 type II toxin-antitoxin system RelE/ParE family toxin [Oleomonas cavernae]
MTPTFADWLGDLRDAKAKARIVARLAAARLGNLGDVEPVGGGVSEMRVPVGPGYRVYFARTGKTVLLLICGGNKASQDRDIKKAVEMLGIYRKGPTNA